MSNIDFDAILAQLSAATERPVEEIQAEIEGLVQQHGYSLPGAIQVWKSDNRFNMNVGKKEYTARVLCKEPPRSATTKGGESSVANIHFLSINPETGEVDFLNGAIWGDERIEEMFIKFDDNKCYTFEAATNNKGNLTRIGNISEAADDVVPMVLDVPPMPISKLVDKLDQYELIRGWVGRIIEPQGGGDPVGFEVGDAGSLLPCTVWFTGKYPKMSPEAQQAVVDNLVVTGEVLVYGYVSLSGSDVNMNGSAVWFAD